MKTKDEVTRHFRNYVVALKTHLEVTVKCIRTDGGGEYGGRFNGLVAEFGIKHERTTPHSPWQNGIAERLNRKVLDLVRSMLTAKDLPKTYWEYACSHAVYILNQMPIEQGIPVKMFHSRDPDFTNILEFGAKVIYKDFGARKLNTQGQVGVYLGKGKNNTGIIIHKANGKVINANDYKVLASCEDHESATKEKNEDSESDTVTSNEDSDSMGEPPVLEEVRSTGENDDEDAEVTTDSAPTPIEQGIIHQGELLRPIRGRPGIYRDRRGNRVALEQVPGAWAATAYKAVMQIPTSVKQAQEMDTWPHWKGAMKEELDAMVEKKTFDIQRLPAGKKTFPCKWVFTTKDEPNGTVRYKARLVAGGHRQQYGIDYDEVFSSVTSNTTIRLILALSTTYDWEVRQLDFNLTERLIMKYTCNSRTESKPSIRIPKTSV